MSLYKQKVLFICTGNSARSQMAEALLRHKADDQFEVFSAGTHPEQVDERAISALKQFGLDVGLLKSKSLTEYAGQDFDYVITLCDKANQECRSYSGAKKQMTWDFPDPKTRSDVNPFFTTINEINNRLSMFVLVESKCSPVDSTQNSISSIQVDSATHTHVDPITFFKCLTDDIRLKCLMLVQYHGELCVCELMAALEEESQPKISRNLAVLKKANLLTTRKHGQWVFYRLTSTLPAWVRGILAQATEGNIDYFQDNLSKLSSMNNRPNKETFCK